MLRSEVRRDIYSDLVAPFHAFKVYLQRQLLVGNEHHSELSCDFPV